MFNDTVSGQPNGSKGVKVINPAALAYLAASISPLGCWVSAGCQWLPAGPKAGSHWQLSNKLFQFTGRWKERTA